MTVHDAPTDDARLREALDELHSYLSDGIAPLVVASSVGLLLTCPPEVTARAVQAWTTAQYQRLGASVPVSDYLFHAMRKLHLMGEFKLIGREDLDAFLAALEDRLLELCPAEDRELLRANLAHLDDAQSGTTAPVGILHRQIGTERPLAAGDDPAAPVTVGPQTERSAVPNRGSQRRTLALLERLEQRLGSLSAASGSDVQDDFLARLVTAATARAGSGEEWREIRDTLAERGVAIKMDDIFRALSRSLPDWVRPDGGGEPARLQGAAEAMRRLVTLEDDPAEAGRRFADMVQAAVEQFNQGSAARAATMFDLAERLIREKHADTSMVSGLRARAHESLDPARLHTLADDPEQHQALRRVLAFFPATSPESLLEDLRHEERRERRRLLVSLLEVHGTAARPLVVDQLSASVATFADRDAFFQRNLVHLLRRIPRGDEEGIESEVDLLTSLARGQRPLALIKETIATLSACRHERAEAALIAGLAEFEGALVKPEISTHTAADLQSVLDRLTFALARRGTSAAARAVVAHGLRRLPALGASLARLDELGKVDLSDDPETVARLIKALEGELPHRLFGFLVQRSPDNALHLLNALAATPTSAVRHALHDILGRFPDTEFAAEATRLLAIFEHGQPAEETPPPAMTGDLELFGLPNLLQSLAQSRTNGLLTVRDRAEQEIGVLEFVNGELRECRAGRLAGEEAIYSLFERPEPGTFQFVARQPQPPPENAPPSRSILPVMLEGMRRYDEYTQARTMVPDEATMRATGHKPSLPEDETDHELGRLAWRQALSGGAVRNVETEFPTDPFRFRRLVSHWVEEGALALE